MGPRRTGIHSTGRLVHVSAGPRPAPARTDHQQAEMCFISVGPPASRLGRCLSVSVGPRSTRASPRRPRFPRLGPGQHRRTPAGRHPLQPRTEIHRRPDISSAFTSPTSPVRHIRPHRPRPTSPQAFTSPRAMYPSTETSRPKPREASSIDDSRPSTASTSTSRTRPRLCHAQGSRSRVQAPLPGYWDAVARTRNQSLHP